MPRLKFLNIYLLSIIVFGFSCKEKPTNQTNEDPGVILDYQWTVDTLYYTPGPGANGNTIIYALGGSSDTTVFAVGFDEWGGPGSMWRFNGKKWERIKLFTFEGGTFTQALILNSLLGFSENDIYAFGDHFYTNSNPPPNFLHTALAIHFDGSQWKELVTPKGFTMQGSSAYSANNFYVGGNNGQLFHYLDGKWIVDTIKSDLFENLSYFNINPVACTNEGVYLSTVQFNQNNGIEYYQFLLYSGNNITLIDSTSSTSPVLRGSKYWKSPSGKLFSNGSNGIYEFQSGRWITAYEMEEIVNITGTDDNRIFAIASSGNVHFYNGKNWKVITTINKPYPGTERLWCTKEGVYISAYYNNRSIIYHGFASKNE